MVTNKLMTNSGLGISFDKIIGSELTALGVVRHRRTSAEFMRRNENDGKLDLIELQFLKTTHSEVNFVATPWLGCLQNVVVSESKEDGVISYKLIFNAGYWVVTAESCFIGVIQSLVSAP